MSVIIKKSEGATPLFLNEDSKPKFLGDYRDNDYDTIKNFFKGLETIVSKDTLTRVKTRNSSIFYYRGVVFLESGVLVLVVTKEGILYCNDEIPDTWISYIKSGMKDINLSCRKNFKAISRGTLTNMFLERLNITFLDYDTEVQKEVLTKLKNNLELQRN